MEVMSTTDESIVQVPASWAGMLYTKVTIVPQKSAIWLTDMEKTKVQ